jgi:tetratricopeptide (TPR) repeat protein
MADAKDLFNQAVVAIRDERDFARGQNLLKEALRADPQNDLAWLWLSRTVKDPQTRLKYIDRALQLNPNNEMAKALREKTSEQLVSKASSTPAVAEPPLASVKAKTKIIGDPLTPQEQQKIDYYLQSAQQAVEANNMEGAIEQWVQVLYIQADHPFALPQSIRALMKMNFLDDAEELIWRALDAGSQEQSLPPILISLARRSPDYSRLEQTRLRLARLPNINAEFLNETAEDVIFNAAPREAFDFVHTAAKTHPEDQTLLWKLGELYELAKKDEEAFQVYKQIVAINPRSEIGKLADAKVLETAPGVTDRERGSVLLAMREALGITLLFLLLAWQDAGLNLLELEPLHIAGIGFSLLGGYLLVTGTSSPSQRGVALLFGGKKDEDSESNLRTIDKFTQYALSAIGIIGLLISFYMVFNHSIDLLLDPVRPDDILTQQELEEELKNAYPTAGEGEEF